MAVPETSGGASKTGTALRARTPVLLGPVLQQRRNLTANRFGRTGRISNVAQDDGRDSSLVLVVEAPGDKHAQT